MRANTSKIIRPHPAAAEVEMTKELKSNKRILIADDDPVSRRILEEFLKQWDFDVTVVSNGTAAWEVLDREDTPRLAVLDWMMPGMQGVEICQLLRKRTDRPYIYVLLLSSRNERRDLLEGLKFGADDYLTKPFDAQELKARLQVGERILELQDGLIAAKDELRFTATHDSLTGVFNRGVVLDAIRREHARQGRERGSFGVILADLDHFKKVNDTYGHPCGDAVLKETARRMMDCTRPYDTVGRYGGEEFLIVVPGAIDSVAFALAERIRKTIETELFVTNSGEVAITASFGVAVGASESPNDPEMLIQLADEALYRAKRKGRNQCESSTSPSLVHSDTGTTD